MMHLFFTFLACLTLCACATPQTTHKPAANKVVITNDLGGLYMERLDVMNDIALSGKQVEIQGTCASACTLFLGMENSTCIGPRARLGFHGPQIERNGRYHNVPEPDRSRVVGIVANHYPPAFRAWFLENAAHLSGDTAWMNASQAIALGARPCAL